MGEVDHGMGMEPMEPSMNASDTGDKKIKLPGFISVSRILLVLRPPFFVKPWTNPVALATQIYVLKIEQCG